MEKRRRCKVCGKLTYDWEKVFGFLVRCWACGKLDRGV